jgi:outer membrane immunogenic protein
MTAGAMAADLPARRVAPAPYAAIPVFSWTGFYVGVNAGYGWGNDNNNRNGFFGGNALTVDTLVGPAPVVAAPGSAIPNNGFFGNNRNNSGFVGGAQIGYNWQMTPGAGFVVGVEADLQWADLGRRNNNNGFFGGNGLFAANPVAPVAAGSGIVAVPPGGANVALFNVGGVNGRNGGNDWFGTARVRLGYAVDRALFYVTGGLAFTDSRNNNNGFATGAFTTGAAVAAIPGFVPVIPAGSAAAIALVNPTGVTCCFSRNSSNNIGWALGGGVEYAWTNNITTKLEGLWVGFDRNRNNNVFGGGAGIVGVSNTGAPIRGTVNNGGLFGRNNADFFLARVGLNFKFGS